MNPFVETLVGLLPLVLPPLLGAVIGYVTNAVAISMLFRPYREIRVFGVRLPFTPGIIPRQRGELAESIAVSVEDELLTEEAVRRQTDRPEFRDGLKAGISAFSAKLISAPVSRWGEFFPGPGDKAGDLARGFVTSDAFEHLVQGVISRAAEALLNTPLSVFLGREDSLRDALSSLLQRFTSEGFLDRAEDGLEGWVRRRSEAGARVSDFVTSEDLSAISRVLEGIYPPVFEGVMAFLKKDETLDELEIRGRRFLHDVIDKLTGLQRLLITAGQYDRTLDENMDRIVADLVAHIERAGKTEENRKNVIAFIEGELRRLSAAGLGDTPERQERVMLIVREVMRKLREIMEDEKFREALSDRLARALLKEDRTVRGLMGTVPGLRQEDIESYLTGLVVRMVRNVFSKDTMAEGLTSDFRHQSIEKILALGSEEKERLDDRITGWTVSMINRKIPDILRSVNIHSLVVDRINSFDIVTMEQLILRVVKKHLRWITVFGGFLGAVIGLAQIAVNYFL